MLEKTLESPLDCKEIQPVHSEGDQPWAQKFPMGVTTFDVIERYVALESDKLNYLLSV